jgi:DNA repair protein RecN (Recombination protein N)
MIKLLRINNIALISRLEVELLPGLTVLTGETGAGKSIVIDSLGILLGSRVTSDLIRSGEERAVVEGVVEASGAAAWLEARGLPAEGDEILLRREIHVSGKGRASLNGALVPVGLLREFAPHVAAIHGQHEPQGLLDPATHVAMVDALGGLSESGPLAATYDELREVRAALERLVRDAAERERRRESLEFQAGEIERAAVRPGEEEALRLEKARQANAGRLAALTGEAYAALYEDDAAVLGRLGQVYRRVEELAALEPDFRAHAEGRIGVEVPLQELALALRDYRERLEVSPARLDEIEARLALLERLKRKYGASVEEILAFAAAAREELRGLASPEEQERRLAERRAALGAAYLERARSLSRRRRAAALTLEKRVRAELAELAMEKTRFEVRFEPEDPEASARDETRWTERGLETAEFMISPNPGEELRPLARVASGGELSRIMLALKTVASPDAAGLTLVFDEVDAGIGGRVAEVVGRKLRAVARSQQVLCVTHLPQIASLADQHLVVRKRQEKGRTLTGVQVLSAEDRIEEVARMLGGALITENARRHAREMVKQSMRI